MTVISYDRLVGLVYLLVVISSAVGDDTDNAEEPVEIIQYDAEWTAKFGKEREIIQGAFADPYIEVHHIGSTAVPGLAAKPIIDILVAMDSISDRDAMRRRLHPLGYVNVPYPDDDKRLFFKKGVPREYHVHIVKRNSWTYWRLLLFRDYLISDLELRTQYERLKKELASKYETDREAYSDAKTDFIERAVTERVRWR